MDYDSPVIYGLEFQARSLASQLAESDAVRFLIGTQSLKLSSNQVHIVEVNEENGSLNTQIFQHSAGEVWSITASPSDADIIATCYNTLADDNTCCMHSAIWRIPQQQQQQQQQQQVDDDGPPPLEQVTLLDTGRFGQSVRITAFHPSDGSRAVSVVDNHFVLWDLSSSDAKEVCSGLLEGKGQPKFTTGKWNPHQNCSQFVTANDGHIRSWDLRSPQEQAWVIEAAHSQLVRDLDFNPNKQYCLATCGDDGCSKFWDVRKATEPLVTCSDHSHWVWSIRFNHFHDQLVLTSSSDSSVILTSIASISSEPLTSITDGEDGQPEQKDKLADGVLARYDEHEDSVYSAEWSSADPWTFASLSYDGRLVINKVPRAEKYRILL